MACHGSHRINAPGGWCNCTLEASYGINSDGYTGIVKYCSVQYPRELPAFASEKADHVVLTHDGQIRTSKATSGRSLPAAHSAYRMMPIPAEAKDEVTSQRQPDFFRPVNAVYYPYRRPGTIDRPFPPLQPVEGATQSVCVARSTDPGLSHPVVITPLVT